MVITIGGTSRPGPTFSSLPQPERRRAAKARPKTLQQPTNQIHSKRRISGTASIFLLELVDLAGFGLLRRVMASTTIDGGKRKAVVVGISGASSSGKTTLARLLRDVFPGTFILHEDDFYKPEAECVYFLPCFLSSVSPPRCVSAGIWLTVERRIPEKDGELDWDCPEALCVPDMIRALSHIRESGTFPVSVPRSAGWPWPVQSGPSGCLGRMRDAP